MKDRIVLSISQRYELHGGSDRYFNSMNELLRSSGNRVIEFASDTESCKNLNDRYSILNTSLSDKKISNLVRYLYNVDARKTVSKILEANPDISLAHLQIYYGQITSSILGVLKQSSIPIIQTLHEYKLTCPVYTHILNGNICEKCISDSERQVLINKCKNNSYLESAIRYAEFKFSRLLGDVDKVDQFICVSQFQKKLMLRGGIPPEKLSVIYNFVDTKNVVSNFSYDSYFLYFGRIEKLKGVETLVRAFAKFHNYQLKIVGDGAYLSELNNLRCELNAENIEILGFKSGEELTELIANARAVMVPSEWYENCSMTVLEAKAYSKPVIASAIGGITEQITDGIDGFLHNAGDITSLCEAVEKLCGLSSQEYSVLCKASKQDLEQRYSMEVHKEALFDIYKGYI